MVDENHQIKPLVVIVQYKLMFPTLYYNNMHQLIEASHWYASKSWVSEVAVFLYHPPKEQFSF